MSTADVASAKIYQDIASADAAYWYQACAQVSRRELLLERRVKQLEAERDQQGRLVDELNQQIDALKYQLVWLAQQLFGKKTEASQSDTGKQDEPSDTPSDEAPKGDSAGQDNGNERKNRGQQTGAKGHGRKQRLNLPFEEIFHDLADDDKCCPECGLPLEQQSFTEDSEQIHWQVNIVRHVHRRRCYKPTCHCGALARIVTAPAGAKLIPKGMLTQGFWVQLILEKFLFQRPLYRIRQMLALEGFNVSQGTLTGGLKKIMVLIQPLYERIVQRNQAAHHWHMDETRWMVFEETVGKTGHRWWLWVVATEDTVVYLLDPTRSSKVPKDHLGEDAQGIVNVDRYSAYKALSAFAALIALAYCWAHQRRDFIRVRDGYCHSRLWATAWIERINALFHINAERIAARDDPQAFNHCQLQLEAGIADMADTWQQQLADDTLRPWEKSILASMKNHWQGLTLFVDNPHVPMDNNEAERRLRNPICGRKNYYGSGSVWSGSVSAMLFTILQTCCINHIDPKGLLLAYFQACAENRGQVPADITPFVPWNLSDENRQAWQLDQGLP
jgi:transposase